MYGLSSMGEVRTGSRDLSVLKTQAYSREASNFPWFLGGGKILYESPDNYKKGHSH